MISNRVKTPCVGICSTGIGDTVCRGCKRFQHEVIDWNRYDNEQKHIILSRLEGFLVQVVSSKIRVVSIDILQSQMEYQQLTYKPEQDPYCWVFDLLKAGASQIEDVTTFGLNLMPEWEDRSLKALKEAVDAEYYILSCAYYERYVTHNNKVLEKR